MKNTILQNKIIRFVKDKSVTLQTVIDNTTFVFGETKSVLKEIELFYNGQIEVADKRISFEFIDKGAFVAELRVASEMLVFYMHTNTFEFDRSHKVWEDEYVKNDASASYCGIINIYNFLHDSFKYNRSDDLGYLIARIFINKENHFFVEGKRQRGMGVASFHNSEIDRTNLRKIIETAVAYSLDFDLLVPPYDDMKVVSLAQMTDEINNSNVRTGKRLGFNYKTDDIDEK